MENCSSVDDSSFISELELEDSVFGPEFEPDNRPSTPTEIIEAAISVNKNLLPDKSSIRYQQVYDSFQEWKKSKGAVSNSERTLMAYFGELEKKFASSTLWSKYSMLRATMAIHDTVDISKYASLTAMLKKYAKDYVPKQAKTFTEAELQRFMETAPDVAWLDVKVSLVLCFTFPTVFPQILLIGGVRIRSVWSMQNTRIAKHSHGGHLAVCRYVLRRRSTREHKNKKQ